MKRHKVTAEEARQRLDVFAAKELPVLSRAFVQKLVENGRITVNRQTEKAGYRLRVDDVIKIDFKPEELEQIEPIDLPVLYEDSDVLVIDKPSGVISHSRGKFWNEPSVASFVRQRTDQEGERAGIVHRLDRATSGVIVCAKNQAALSWLQRQFSARKVKKVYIAIVGGHLEPTEAIINMPIERNPKESATFRVGTNGKQAITKYLVQASNRNYDLVQLEPQTGRTHQLRVHLAKQGHPIVGDLLYKGEPFERLLLHASKLELTLPDGQKRSFEAPLPPLFQLFMESRYA